MQSIGKLDKTKFSNLYQNIITDVVIMTNERKKHIIVRHPEILKDLNRISEVLLEPEYIFQDRKNKDTVLLVRRIEENNKIYRLVLKLNTNTNVINKFNSVISFWSISEKKLKQYIRNEKIIFQSIDNIE